MCVPDSAVEVGVSYVVIINSCSPLPSYIA